jgi:hypothetical protein
MTDTLDCMFDMKIFEDARNALGDPKEMHAAHQRMMSDLRFYFEHEDEWREEYPDRWVAVYDGEMIAVAETQQAVIKALQDKDISPADALTRFVDKQRYIYVL